MINFIYGDYGSGKSTHILELIKQGYQNKIRSFLIVPEQQTVSKERQIASLLPPDAQLLCEVTNFSRLSNSIFRDLGGLKYNYVTKSGKNLLMYRAISTCRDELLEYKISKEHEKGSIKLLLDMVSEFRSFNVTVANLEASIDKLENEHLKLKLRDIIKIWSTYETLLAERFSDPYDNLGILAEKIAEGDYFKGCNVYIDSFYGFSLPQIDVLKTIIDSASNVTFAFDCPYGVTEKTTQFAMVAKNASAISRLCKNQKTSVLQLNDDLKHKTEDMRLLSKYIWDFSKVDLGKSENITLAKCTDEFEECEYVSSEICKLIMSGYKFSEIAIIARKIDTYRGILDYTLKKYNIPHFMSSPTDWLTKPLLKMIFSALNFAEGQRREDLISFAKSGYVDIDPSSLSELESYITRWDIYGSKFFNDDYWSANPDGFVEVPTESQLKRLAKIIEARDLLLDKLSIIYKSFAGGVTVKDACVSLFELLSSLNIIEKLENERKTLEKSEAYIISQAWEAILNALDTLAYICGDSIVDALTFSTLLYYAFVDAKVGSIPTGEDNVIISDAHSIRAEGIRHVFVLGANEGSFPANVVESSIFSDADKRDLKESGVSFSIEKDYKSDDELLFFKSAVAIASEGAHVCALASGIDGSVKQESIGYQRIKELFSDITIVDTSKLDTIDKIYTPFLAKEHFGLCEDELKLAIKNELDLNEFHKKNFSNEQDSVSQETTSTLYGDKLRLSQTQLTLFSTCKFKYYAEKHLKLQNNNPYFFSSLDSGTLVHSILEHFVIILRDTPERFFSLDEESLKAEIKLSVDEIANNYIAFVCKGVHMTNRLSHLFDKLKRNLYIFVEKLVNEFKSSKFKPLFVELNFDWGKDSAEPLVFKLDNGKSAYLIGSADRVDAYRTNDKTYLRIADYKISNKSFTNADLEAGKALQLPIYLFSLCKMRDCEFKKKLLDGTKELVPAGFFYVPLNVGKSTIDGDITEDADATEITEKVAIESASKYSGRFLDDEEIILAQDPAPGKNLLPSSSSTSRRYHYISLDGFEEIYQKMANKIIEISNEMYSGIATAEPQEIAGQLACENCDFRAICRRRSHE